MDTKFGHKNASAKGIINAVMPKGALQVGFLLALLLGIVLIACGLVVFNMHRRYAHRPETSEALQELDIPQGKGGILDYESLYKGMLDKSEEIKAKHRQYHKKLDAIE
jgi:hypothetical protein